MFQNIFELIVLFSALFGTINTVAAGTDSVVIVENITVLRSAEVEAMNWGYNKC